jgi:hypothetical protein
MSKVETITVKSALGNNDVALCGKNIQPPRPGDLCCRDAEVEVAKTARVMRRPGR